MHRAQIPRESVLPVSRPMRCRKSKNRGRKRQIGHSRLLDLEVVEIIFAPTVWGGKGSQRRRFGERNWIRRAWFAPP
jgi:hypothetical protein